MFQITKKRNLEYNMRALERLLTHLGQNPENVFPSFYRTYHESGDLFFEWLDNAQIVLLPTVEGQIHSPDKLTLRIEGIYNAQYKVSGKKVGDVNQPSGISRKKFVYEKKLDLKTLTE